MEYSHWTLAYVVFRFYTEAWNADNCRTACFYHNLLKHSSDGGQVGSFQLFITEMKAVINMLMQNFLHFKIGFSDGFWEEELQTQKESRLLSAKHVLMVSYTKSSGHS